MVLHGNIHTSINGSSIFNDGIAIKIVSYYFIHTIPSHCISVAVYNFAYTFIGIVVWICITDIKTTTIDPYFIRYDPSPNFNILNIDPLLIYLIQQQKEPILKT